MVIDTTFTINAVVMVAVALYDTHGASIAVASYMLAYIIVMRSQHD